MRKMALFVIYIMLATSFASIFSIQCIASPPGVPTNFTATTISKTRIDLTWTKGANADKTYIERNSLLSSWTIGAGTFIYYNTGSSYSDSGLIENTHYYYQAWSWNQTDGLNLNPAHTDNTTFANQPPFFGSPTPSNSSTNNPLSLTWSIPINDLEGNTFTWTIHCSNTQKNNGTAASNGTKSLTLTGLVYFKTYKVWVNATDPTGSGLYTRKWYNFTTKVNNPPVFGIPSPANASTGNLLSFTWSIPINDPEGNPFIWTIQCNNGQTSSGTGATNGTKSLVLTGLVYFKTYKVWVNATDPTGSGQYTRRWYMFTTKGNVTNTPPVFGVPSPTNGSTGNLLSFTWGIPINDPQGDTFTWTIQCNNTQVNTGSGASNGTKSVAVSGLAYSTTYTVWVNATDPTPGSNLYTRKLYTFTTKQNLQPNKPSLPSGQAIDKIKEEYSYTTSTTDPEGDKVYYLWDLGDGTTSGWLGPYNSGATCQVNHTWNTAGNYNIKVKAKDIYGNEGSWSDPLPIKIRYLFNYLILQFLEWLFQRFPHAFPLLRQLMGY